MLRPLAIIIALIVSSIITTAHAADPATAPAAENISGLPSLAHSSISIPWEDLRGLLEKNNPAIERPPIDFAFSPANYDAVVADKTVTITATVEVTLLVDGWTLAPMGAANSGVTATVDGQPAALVVRGEGLFVLLKGKGPKKVSLTLSRDVTADAGGARSDLPLLPARW